MKNLSSEVIESIRLLLDKPISPLTQKQLADLINKQTIPTESVVPMLALKHRGDLLVMLLRKEHLTVHTIKLLFQNLRKDILNYPTEQMHLLFQLALKQEEMELFRGD